MSRRRFGLRDTEAAIPNCELTAILNQQSHICMGFFAAGERVESVAVGDRLMGQDNKSFARRNTP